MTQIESSIDCILLPFQGVDYLVPMIGVAEILLCRLTNMGPFVWHSQSLALTLLPDLVPAVGDLKVSHIAILQSMPGSYHAVYLDKAPQALKIKETDLQWAPESAAIQENKFVLSESLNSISGQIMIFDLNKLTVR